MTSMEGGAGNVIIQADTTDVFNPKQPCRNCDALNDVNVTICTKCGKDVYGTNKMTIEIEDTAAMLNLPQESLSPAFFDKTIAAPDPSSSDAIVAQNEGMEQVPNIEDFLRDEELLKQEGRKERNNNNDFQNLHGDDINVDLPGTRPVFTSTLVIYWLYYLVWFVVGIILTAFEWIEVNKAITVVCMVVPSFIMLILTARISCLNSINIQNINHFENLNDIQRQKYKLMSILVTILLMFAGLLRAIWWIYCINFNIDYRFKTTLITLLVNEFGTIFLINIDYIKMSYFEPKRAKQGIFGITRNPYPCLLSLSTLVTIQLVILAYGAFLYTPPDQDCTWWVSFLFECKLNTWYVTTACVTFLIPVGYGIDQLVIWKKKNRNPNESFRKLSVLEQHIAIVACVILMIFTFILALAIFAGFQESYTWIHLLILPELFGVMYALFKLRQLSL
eukprot:185716_1